MSLQELRREPKAGLARAGRADAAEIEVAGVGGIFRTGVHGQKLRPGQNDIVLKFGVYKGLYISLRTP